MQGHKKVERVVAVVAATSSNSNATKRKFKQDPGAVDGGWKKKESISINLVDKIYLV